MSKKTISSMYSIGERIQKKRNSLGLKQEEVASKVGIGLRTIQSYENNEVNPKIETLEKIAIALDSDLEYFIFGKTKEEIESEQYIYFTSMYKNLEDLKSINYLMQNINHEVDNIENNQLRKKIIKAIEESLRVLKKFLKYVIKSKEAIDNIDIDINSTEFKIRVFHELYDKYEAIIQPEITFMSQLRQKRAHLYNEHEKLLEMKEEIGE